MREENNKYTIEFDDSIKYHIYNIEGINYKIGINLGVPMIYEELSGNAWITSKKLTQKNIYQLIYSLFRANNKHFILEFDDFVTGFLTRNSWIINEITSMLFSNTNNDEDEKKS